MNKPYLNILIRVLPEKLLTSIFISIFILNGIAIAKSTRPKEDLTPRGRNYISNHFGENGLQDVNGVFTGVLGTGSSTFTLLRHADKRLKNRVLITSAHQLCQKYLSQPSQLEIINTNVEPFQVVKAQSVDLYNQKPCTSPDKHCPSSPQEAPRQAYIDHADIALVILKEPLRESKDYCLTTHQSTQALLDYKPPLKLITFHRVKGWSDANFRGEKYRGDLGLYNRALPPLFARTDLTVFKNWNLSAFVENNTNPGDSGAPYMDSLGENIAAIHKGFCGGMNLNALTMVSDEIHGWIEDKLQASVCHMKASP